MRPLFLFALVAASAVVASPFRVLVDRPGEFEIEWNRLGYALDTLSNGTVSVRFDGMAPSDIPGDLAAGRLQGVVALPSTGEWKLEVLTDSGDYVPGSAWSRVPRFDRVGGRMVEAMPNDREGWSESKIDGFRLLRMDYPLVRPESGGVRIGKRLRLRLTWVGVAKLPYGSVWKRVVGNPGGVRELTRPAARKFTTGSLKLDGAVVEVSVGDPDPFSSAEDGLVRLTGAQLANALGRLPGAGDAFANIAVYSGASDTLSSRLGDSLNGPALSPIPIQRIDIDHDGVIGPADEIRFWVRGPNLWVPDSVSGLGWSYTIHPYDRRRKYLIRLDAAIGSPELARSGKATGGAAFSTVAQPVWIGQPNKLKELEIGKASATEPDLGKSWYWVSAENPGVVEFPMAKQSFPGKTEDAVLARIVTIRNSWFGETAASLDSFGIPGASENWIAINADRGVWSGTGLTSDVPAFRASFRGDRMAISGIDLVYRRNLSLSDSAVFPAPAIGAVDISVSDDKECWVLEDGIATRLCTIESGRLLDTVVSPRTWFAVFPKSAASVPVTLDPWSAPTQAHAVTDFGASTAADILVVAPSSLMAIAEEYALHREAAFQVRRMSAVIARTEDIYSMWSGGQMDPVAIRDCIRYARKYWGISHVLLLGAGHVDPRQVMGESPDVLIPQWEDGSVSTDDFFTFLDPANTLGKSTSHFSSVALGRVPARSIADARHWLDKLKGFEDPAKADFGPWRNTVVLAADDVMQLSTPDAIGDHTNQSEGVATSLAAEHPWIRLEKLYLLSYPANALYQKPEAARDLQKLLNRGAVGLNYIGHGGPEILADENLLDNSAVDRTLVNKTRPFLFFAGSCSVGRNDIPNSVGLSELLTVTPGKGALATVSGTRPTYPEGNGRLSSLFWGNIVDTSKAVTIGEALIAAKTIQSEPGSGDNQLGSGYMNRDAYNILGDPASILIPGGLPVAVDGLPDTIAALAQIRIRGRANGALGYQVRLEIEQGLDSSDARVSLKGEQRFRNSSIQMLALQGGVVSDTLGSTIQIPAQIPFGDSATLRVYTWNTSTRRDGGQALSPRLLRGTASGANIESQGPDISIRPCDSSWTAGVAFGKLAQFHLPFCLSVDLHDTSGISSRTGPDEGVVFSIPGVKEPWHPDLRQEADFRRASAQFVIDSTVMAPGQTYTFAVLARDLMGNLSTTRIQIQPLDYAEYSLYEVFNSPNPVKAGENTAFYFKLASEPDTNGTVDSHVKAAIRIHTVSGKLVRVLRTELSQKSQPRPRAVWDLRDSFGNPVGNGLYPYSVVLRIPNETGTNTTEIVRKGIVAISR